MPERVSSSAKASIRDGSWTNSRSQLTENFIARSAAGIVRSARDDGICSCKLAQEAKIVLRKKPNIGDIE